MFCLFKGAVSQDFWLILISWIEAIWAPDKQAKMVSLKNSFSWIYSRKIHLSWAIWANRSQSLIWFERNEQMSEWAMSELANSQPWYMQKICLLTVANMKGLKIMFVTVTYTVNIFTVIICNCIHPVVININTVSPVRLFINWRTFSGINYHFFQFTFLLFMKIQFFFNLIIFELTSLKASKPDFPLLHHRWFQHIRSLATSSAVAAAQTAREWRHTASVPIFIFTRRIFFPISSQFSVSLQWRL